MKNPPILIAVLGFFAALAGFGFLFYGLRVIGFDWFGAFGDLPALEHVGIWGWLAVATGIIWLLAALGLWALQPWARWFVIFLAGFALFEAVLAFFSAPGTGVAFAMAIMPALVLWYLSTSEVKAAFGEEERSEPAAMAAPVALAAPVAPATPAWSPRRSWSRQRPCRSRSRRQSQPVGSGSWTSRGSAQPMRRSLPRPASRRPMTCSPGCEASRS